jgi:hypothetical protein
MPKVLIESYEKRTQIRILSKEGKLVKTIATKLKIPIVDVVTILRRQKAAKDKAARKRANREEKEPVIAKLPSRCKGCGAMVYMPCVKCVADAHKAIMRIQKVGDHYASLGRQGRVNTSK